ncbi:MAG: SusC/RagA family TonB-linked outer membrane protein [Candidatus Marinimicrobia bacterium]|nr:SusC/RagA family TonB-linked outer membrane protein [Candidatus Neomarinimicrobiota bacterium]
MLKRTLLVLGFAVLPLVAFAQQGAVISGTVTDAATGDVLRGANVNISSLGIGDATGVDGVYRITATAAAAQGQDAEITVNFIGYAPATATISLTAGDHSQDFALARDVLGLSEVIVTGVVGATPLTKVPFAVGRLSAADLQVPAISAESAIRGKIAGVKVIRGSGRPGSSASVQLRGSTSINASGRSQEPLYIVDGVILSAGASMADIDARDIETIEVVKGAAGASLYGSRAAQGVIQINTSRGKNLALGQTRITFRSETGTNDLPNRIDLVQYHTWKLNAAGEFVDKDGNVVDPRDAAGGKVDDWFVDAAGDEVIGIAFQDNPYKFIATGVPEAKGGGPPQLIPGGGFDNVDLFFNPGQYQTSTISIGRNSATTNFFASFVNSQNPGVLYQLDGSTRNSIRVNLDHSLRETLRLSVSTYYSQSTIDEVLDGTVGGAFFDLTFMTPDVDLLAVDETDYERGALPGNWDPKLGDDAEIFVNPDPTSIESNPLYELTYLDRERTRNRFLVNANLNYRPFDWISLESNVSLDRTESLNQIYYPKGYKSVSPSSVNEGWFFRGHDSNEAINADLTASFFQTIGALNLRVKLRYLYEQDAATGTGVRGSNFAVGDVRTLNAAADKAIESDQAKILAEGFFFIGGIDFDDKYILDVMTRRDRSSLFGEEEREHDYYRFSGAYRISEEPFWVIKDLFNEFKIRFSQGTAGSRPAFAAQYETYPLSGGFIGGQETLGNKELRPEFATETEFGIDFAVMNRFYIQLTSATSIIEDQILLVPLSGTFGVPAQWQNAGTLKNEIFEASVQASVFSSSALSWDIGFVYDAMTQEMTKLDVPKYTWAPPNSQDMTIFFNRQGERFGTMYGDRWITKTGQLPDEATASEFDVNDDGYVVWVGAGNTYTDGISKYLWGTTSDDGYDWGIPIAEIQPDEDTGGTTTFLKIGNSIPDFNFGLTSNLRFGNLSLYVLFEGQSGGNIYSMTSQWGMRDNKVAQVDQFGKDDGKKKPTTYYQALYNVRKPNSHFVEDGTYMKLQELSLRYSLSLPQFTNQITLGIIGRNLMTWTDYSGYDPEVGTGGGQGGSAVLTRFDGYQYPNFRTIAFVVEVAL